MDLQTAVTVLGPQIVHRLKSGWGHGQGADDQFQEMCIRTLKLPMIGNTETDFLKLLWSTARYSRLVCLDAIYGKSAPQRANHPQPLGKREIACKDPPHPTDLLDSLREFCHGASKLGRLVVMMHFWMGMTPVDISKHFGKGEKWASKVLERMRDKYLTGHNVDK